MLSPESVGAARVWCRTDPTFRVNGIVGNVYVSGELDVTYDTTGPIQLTFFAPTGSVVELLAVDPGFGYGNDIQIAYDDDLKDDEKVGATNQVVRVKTELRRSTPVKTPPSAPATKSKTK